jgi:hypothetical protein
MINFSIGFNSHNDDIHFASYPRKEEWELFCNLFEGNMDMNYFKSIRKQLQEIEMGKRTNFEEDDRSIPSLNDWFRFELNIVSHQGIAEGVQLSERREKKVLTVSITDFKQLVDRWIKFVEVNTKAFAKKEKKHP